MESVHRQLIVFALLAARFLLAAPFFFHLKQPVPVQQTGFVNLLAFDSSKYPREYSTKTSEIVITL